MQVTHAIDRAYARVITTKRDGECRYCAAPTVAGRDFAAVDGAGKWHAICAQCAAVTQSQVIGLIKRIDTIAATLTDTTALVGAVTAIDQQATLAVQGDENAAAVVIPAMFAILAQAQGQAAQVTQAAARASLPAGVAEAARHYNPNRYGSRRGEGCLTCGDPVAALDGWAVTGLPDARGWASLHRGACADTTYAQREAARQAKAQAAPLLRAALDTLRLRLGRDNVRVAIPGITNDLDFLFLSFVTHQVERHVGAPGSVRAIALDTPQSLRVAQYCVGLTDEALLDAQALYGQAMGACGRCGSPLTKDDSRARGLGPECATKV